METSRQDTLALLGRILLALMFIAAGIFRALTYAASASLVAGMGIPMGHALVASVLLLELVGGLALLLGWQVRWAALALALYTLAGSVFVYTYWALPSWQVVLQQLMMSKSLAVAGGLLGFAAFGGGAFSLDARRLRGPAPR